MFRGGGAPPQLRRRYGSESEERQNDSYVIPPHQQNQHTQSESHYSQAQAESSLPTSYSSSSSSIMSLSNASRDRTQEFMSAVRSFQGRQMNGQLGGGAKAMSNKQVQLARQSGEFMKIARSIGKDITNTYTKLEKLTLLAKRKTLFDDR